MSSSPTSSSSSEPAAAVALATMLDVLCGVDFVVGSGHIAVRDFLHLAPETVLRLDQAAGGDLEVCVNGVTVAQGEVAVLEDLAALRLTRLVRPSGAGWE